MKNIFPKKTTMVPRVAYPGFISLIILSLLCAIFPNLMSEALTTIQNAIYKNSFR